MNVLHDPKWSKQVSRLVQVATFYIAMNTLIKPFDNVLVRRAVNMAINKLLIVRLIQGRGVVADTFLPPTMPGYGHFLLYPYNPAKARQLMAQAGYGSGVSTTFYSDDLSDDPRISQAIIPMLANIGIKATLRVVNGNTLQTLSGWVLYVRSFGMGLLQLRSFAGERVVDRVFEIGHLLEAAYGQLLLFESGPDRFDARLLGTGPRQVDQMPVGRRQRGPRLRESLARVDGVVVQRDQQGTHPLPVG